MAYGELYKQAGFGMDGCAHITTYLATLVGNFLWETQLATYRNGLYATKAWLQQLVFAESYDIIKVILLIQKYFINAQMYCIG